MPGFPNTRRPGIAGLAVKIEEAALGRSSAISFDQIQSENLTPGVPLNSDRDALRLRIADEGRTG
jgi:hypothetical protein